MQKHNEQNSISLKQDETQLNAAKLLSMDRQALKGVFNRLSVDQQRDVVMRCPWKERMEFILMSDDSRSLVQSLPEEELYWTIQEIGPDDALPLVSRSSHEQFQYIVDIDCWKRDRMEPGSIFCWYRMLSKCNEAKVIEWFSSADDDFLLQSLQHFVTVFKLEEETDISEEYDNMPVYTLDGRTYFQFSSEEVRTVIMPLMNCLYENDRQRFDSLIEGIMWDSPSELEESAFHWRRARIAEKGFPGMDEAMSLYQHITDREIEMLKRGAGSREEHAAPEVPDSQLKLRYAFKHGMLPDFLAGALLSIEHQERLDTIQHSMTLLANKIIIADCLDVHQRADVRRALSKAAGYMNIGIQYLSGSDCGRAVLMIETIHPEILFRVGNSRVRGVQKAAASLPAQLSLPSTGQVLSFYHSPLSDTLRGLAMSRPLFFEGNVKQGSMVFKDFETLDEIRRTEKVLARIAVIDTLLFTWLGVPAEAVQAGLEASGVLEDSADVTCVSVFLTVLANYLLNKGAQLEPLTVGELQHLLEKVFEIKGSGGWRIRESMLSDILSWLRSFCTIEPDDQEPLDHFIGYCLRSMEEEFSQLVGQKTIEPRYVNGIMVYNT